MPCDYIRNKFSLWSEEKQRVILTALGGAISCRSCQTVHYFKEGAENGQKGY